ncbi:MAG: hypothetical protein SGARI_005355 [Bacillariaceae sp.]
MKTFATILLFLASATGAAAGADSDPIVSTASCAPLLPDEPPHHKAACSVERSVYVDEGYMTLNFTSMTGLKNGNGYTMWLMLKNVDYPTQLYNLGGFVYNNHTTPSTDFVYQGVYGRCSAYKFVTEEDDSSLCSIIFPQRCGDHASCKRVGAVGILDISDVLSGDLVVMFKSHGKFDPNLDGNEDMLTTFNGGCRANTIHYPKSELCPSGRQTCKDVVAIEF